MRFVVVGIWQKTWRKIESNFADCAQFSALRLNCTFNLLKICRDDGAIFSLQQNQKAVGKVSKRKPEWDERRERDSRSRNSGGKSQVREIAHRQILRQRLSLSRRLLLPVQQPDHDLHRSQAPQDDNGSRS